MASRPPGIAAPFILAPLIAAPGPLARAWPRLLPVLLIALACGGCTTMRRSFPGHKPDNLWTAMVAVAGTPDYAAEDPEDLWVVKENHAHADPDQRRIEVYRELVRSTDLEKNRPHTDRRTYRFQILLEDVDPPRVAFSSRGTAVPKQALDEAKRYFDDLSSLVGDRTPMEPLREGGATTPEVAVRDLLFAMFRQDETAILRIIVPHDDAEVLWTGASADTLPDEARERLDRRIIRPARSGEVVTIDDTEVRVTENYVRGDRRLILATVAGKSLEPFFVVRLQGRWWVDAERIIARKKATGQ